MKFIEAEAYHIYNRGNNSQKIFFNEENYLFFLRKIRKELSPHCEVLAYCLMPNHFHLMLLIKSSEGYSCYKSSDDLKPESSNQHPSVKSSDDYNRQLFKSTKNNLNKPRESTLNNAIAVLLRSYTRAIQKQENLKGSLFQQKTKAQQLNNYTGPALNHPSICMHYIHQNL